MKTRWMVCTLFSALAVQGQSALPIQYPQWLAPSDSMIQEAINYGFGGNWTSRKANYVSVYKKGIQAEPLSSISVLPPLVCAVNFGAAAHERRQPIPELTQVKSSCLHRLNVLIVHYSADTNKNWLCVLELGDTRLQPSKSEPDKKPVPETFYNGLSQVPGYSYYDTFWFDVPNDWPSTFLLTFSDDFGNRHVISIDSSLFTEDAARHVLN